MSQDATRAEHAASRSRSAAQRAETSLQFMEARLDRTLLTMEAMWTLMRDRLQVTEEELAGRPAGIDLADGARDGKARRPSGKCVGCSRTVPRRHGRCMDCGAELRHDPFA
ncbi:MAG: hypothetical protein ACE5JG_03955 [Planctomycetota bacterium]